MELTRLQNLAFIYVVRFRKISGETYAYKEVCSKLLKTMKL